MKKQIKSKPHSEEIFPNRTIIEIVPSDDFENHNGESLLVMEDRLSSGKILAVSDNIPKNKPLENAN